MNARGPATELIVVRHGETAWNAIGKQQGQLDTELSGLGVAQAQAVAEALVGEGIDVLYSSDLGRALQTAEIIARKIGLAIVADVRLRERHLGIIQGMTMAQFQLEHPQEYALFRSDDPDYVIPGGESVRQRHERSVACVNDLAGNHSGRRVLVVTHGGVLNGLFRHTLGLPLAGLRSFSLCNGSINTFAVKNGQWRLNRWGDISHLRQLGTKDDS